MKIEKIYPKGFAANSYILTADGKNAIVIDPAQPRILDEVKKLGLTPQYVLLTHCHFDHVGGVATLQAAGAKVLCSEQEKSLVGTKADLFEMFGADRGIYAYTVNDTLKEGEKRLFCGIFVQSILTPGHTGGGMCYLISDEKEGENRALFTGDTLFCGCVGRTDFPSGNAAELNKSLQKLAALPFDCPIYAGHEEDSTLDEERRNNPYMIN
jgi:glyoxylase-like metal-dependent hydrolase (beta-lactamase superfamily II)